MEFMAVAMADRPAPRPAASFASGGGGVSMGLASPGRATSMPMSTAVKGVMLCNRPDPSRPPPPAYGGRVLAGYTTTGGPVHHAYALTCGLRHENVHPRGQDTDLAQRMAHAPPLAPKPPPVAERAKAHLVELLERRRALEARAAEEERAKEEKRRRVAEEAQLLRDLIRSGEGERQAAEREAAASDATAAAAAGSAEGAAEDVERAPSVRFAASSDCGAAHGAAAAVAVAAPAALHPPAADRSASPVDGTDDAEAAQLVDFAAGLDADGFLEALEDGAGATLARQQLADLASEEALLKARLAAAEAVARRSQSGVGAAPDAAAAASGDPLMCDKAPVGAVDRRRLQLALGSSDAGETAGDEGHHPSRTTTGSRGYNSDSRPTTAASDPDAAAPGAGGPLEGEADACSVADSALACSAALRAVHSKRSMTAVVARVCDAYEAAPTAAQAVATLKQALASGSISATEASGIALPVQPEPPTVAHHEYLERVLQRRALVGSLPYQRQHPGV